MSTIHLSIDHGSYSGLEGAEGVWLWMVCLEQVLEVLGAPGRTGSGAADRQAAAPGRAEPSTDGSPR